MSNEGLAISLVICVSILGGMFFGMAIGSMDISKEKNAIIECIEKPKECKIRYDFYKLNE